MRVTREQRRATRAALITAVADIVEADGLDAATVTAVAERAGVTTGAIYSQFGDRTTLLAAGVDELRSRWVPPFPGDLPLPAALRRWTGEYLALVHTTQGHGLMVAQAALTVRQLSDEVLLAHDAVATAHTLDVLGEALRVAADLAGVELELPPSMAAGLVLAMLKGAATLAVTNPDVVDADVVADRVLRMLLPLPAVHDV
jgi:AcrR family transcriptional regulator